jgi:peptidoglycan/LPS O-acetylase OafA/YrhL
MGLLFQIASVRFLAEKCNVSSCRKWLPILAVYVAIAFGLAGINDNALAQSLSSPAQGARIYVDGVEGHTTLPWGVRATVTWSAPGFKEGTCGVFKIIGHENTVFNGGGGPIGTGQNTGALFRKAIYRLTCTDGDRTTQAEVSVNPSISKMLVAYPFATVSTAAFYVVLLLLLIPWSKSRVFRHLAHPIPPHQRHLSGFDAFRGFAATWVAMGHCWWATYPVFAPTQAEVLPLLALNSKAVPIFAILSGFLIYRSVLSVRTINDLRTYAVRRFFRIYPVYALGVVMSALAGQYVGTAHSTKLGMFVSDLGMFTVISWPGGFANPPTWSLYVEVLFYVVLPLIVLTLGQKRMVPFAAAMIVAMLAADYDSRVFGLWKFFLAGIIASEISARLTSKVTSLMLFVVGALLLYWDIFSAQYGAHDWFADFGLTYRHGDGETVALGIGCSLLLMSLPNLRRLGTWLSILPLRMLGTISYSVYVIHFFYILISFPKLGLFSRAGHPESTAYFQTLQAMPNWYLPLIFFPGILFWGLISYVLVERPGIMLGAKIVARSRGIATAQELK